MQRRHTLGLIDRLGLRGPRDLLHFGLLKLLGLRELAGRDLLDPWQRLLGCVRALRLNQVELRALALRRHAEPLLVLDLDLQFGDLLLQSLHCVHKVNDLFVLLHQGLFSSQPFLGRLVQTLLYFCIGLWLLIPMDIFIMPFYCLIE